ncbi:MAG: DUF58 domain-containing protein [Ornithinimicrobium sp.]
MTPLQVLTPRGGTFFVLGLCTVLAGIALGYPDITRVGIVLTLLPILALAIARGGAPQLAVSRTVAPHRLQPDEPGIVEASFRNVGTRRTPLYLAQEQLDVHLGDQPRFVLHPLERGQIRRLSYNVRSSTRGAYRLGPLSLRQRDPFGLTYVAVRLSSTTEVVVLPRVVDLTGRASAAQGRGSEGERPQMVALHGEDDVSIRSYRDGDELRRVHWPATAHRGELMVRQEDRPARRRAVLILDSRSSAHGRPPLPSASFEYAISALASVARALLLQGYVVHLLSTQTVSEGTASQPMDLDTLLDTLARAQRDDDLSLEGVAGPAHTFTSGGVLAVAALVAQDAEELRHLASIREHGSTAIAFVLDRRAFEAHARDDAFGSQSRPGSAPAAKVPALSQAHVLNEAGWATVACTPEVGINDAWSHLRRAPALRGIR